MWCDVCVCVYIYVYILVYYIISFFPLFPSCCFIARRIGRFPIYDVRQHVVWWQYQFFPLTILFNLLFYAIFRQGTWYDAKNKEQTTEIHTTINQKEVQRIYLFLLTHITSQRVVMSCYFVFCLLLLLYIISTYHI